MVDGDDLRFLLLGDRVGLGEASRVVVENAFKSEVNNIWKMISISRTKINSKNINSTHRLCPASIITPGSYEFRGHLLV